jgi:hypothetical protein
MYYNKHNTMRVGDIDISKIYLERVFLEKYSRNALSSKIASAHDLLEVGRSSKDSRLQPIGELDPADIPDIIRKSNLKIVDIVKPGKQGSTSGQLDTYIVSDDEGNTYPVVFGKGKGFSVRDEDAALSSIQFQLEELIGNKKYITLSIDGNLYKVDSIKSTPGTPKSDFHFEFRGVPNVFISHKKGKSPRDFQQYSGTSLKAGINISQHPEVVRFVSAIKKRFPEGLSSGQSFYRKIKDPELMKLAVYGPEYGGDFGIDNVQALLQGPVTFERMGAGSTYSLKSNHTLYNGEIPSEKYEPILYIYYNASRGGNHGIKFARTGVLPIAKASTSTVKI